MNPVVMTVMLVTKDGVPIDAVHLPTEQVPAPVQPESGRRDLALVIAHGFTMTWQRPMVWKLVRSFNRQAGVITFDFRGHGRSGGLSTLGDKEIEDLDVAVRYARELGYQRVVSVGFSMGGSVVLRHAALLGGVDAVVSVSGPG
ncbi:MAG: alpha/beta hydrolase, partial [Trebonia sp.]